MPTVRILLLASLLVLGVAGPASAADFYVDDNGPAPVAGCQDATHPCSTILAALTASRALAGTGDTINLAAGTYAEDVAADQPQDNGLTIAGPTGLLSVAKIQLANNTSYAVKLGAQSAPLNTSMTLRDLTVTVPAGSGTSKLGILVSAINPTLTNVVVSMAEPASDVTGLGFVSPSGTNTLDHVVVLTKSDAPGIFLIGPATTNGTRVGVSQLNTGTGANGIAAVQATLNLVGSLIRLPAASGASGVTVTSSGSLTVDSSLIEGGISGVTASQTTAGTAAALVRRSTIDSATPGIDDGGQTGSSVNAFTDLNAAAVAQVTVVESLLVDLPTARNKGGVGTAAVTCQSSMVPQTSLSALIHCGAAAGNSASNPTALFLDAPGLDYRLKPDSPAIDAGAASGPAASEPALDFAGNPRSVDGTYDCVVRPDLGAYEQQGQANTAPAVTASGPASGIQGSALAFSAIGSDNEDGAGALTYGWAFSDGGSAAGALAQHAFTKSGPGAATVTVTDSHGCTATAKVDVSVASPPLATVPPVASSVDRTAPVISKLSVKGRRLRLTLTEAARLRVTITRNVCRTVAGHRRCSVHTVRRMTVAAKAGANSVRLPAKAKLAAGRYRFSLVATDAAANASAAHRLSARLR